MIETTRACRGMVTAPHHLAAEAGLDILKAGGTAVEAALTTAATLAVVYPHMTGIGGDGFWLIAEPGRPPIAIEACGRAAAGASLAFYAEHGQDAIPRRGPLAANTTAGTIAGWEAARVLSRTWQAPLPLGRLLEAPIAYARDGIVVTRSQAELTRDKQAELEPSPGFAAAFMPSGVPPREADILRQPALAATFERLAHAGLDDYYHGDLARVIAAELAAAGSPLRLDDIAGMRAQMVEPLTTTVSGARLYNMPPPTQGLTSLMILALFDRLGIREAEGFDHIHGLVEASKQAFLIRDTLIGDPDFMPAPARDFLLPGWLDAAAARIDRSRALPWPPAGPAGDTVWLGACDAAGRSVSLIQSIYFEFGSGVVLPSTGIVWQNRGSSFRLADSGWNALAPGRRPFHTLNPAMAEFTDGRHMVYGTMGGEGQPQTQAAIFSRYGFFGQPLQSAITAPRWLLGRTWGDTSTTLKLEGRFPREVTEALAKAGHQIEIMPDFTDVMGHAGALVRLPSGVIEGASDPRSDGKVAAW